MSKQVTITLSDELYRHAEDLARRGRVEVADILTDSIAISLATLDPELSGPTPVASIADEELLALTELQLPAAQDRRLSELLEQQQAGELGTPERAELLAFMQIYQQSLLLKAQALHEAVGRGLRPPLVEALQLE